MPFTYPYPRPAVSCDVVVFTMRADDLAVLLIQRKGEPFKGQWALPGGFVNENESLDRAAARELSEETGLTGARLEQLAAFGDPGRDPRGHTVTIAYVTFLVAEAKITPGDDAAAAEWHAFRKLSLGVRPISGTARRSARRVGRARKTSRSGATDIVPVAFDHGKIIARAHRRLLQCLDDPLRDRAFDLLPSRFTLAELHRFYEVVSGRTLPQRMFRKRLLDYELVLPATSKPTAKPADQLYRWNRR
ncbi:MAG TPA: NUDIX domain-containing protein [Labilithrix sp.]|nr:NUDIX domain-containing protein [Labilithrix sp.]